MSVATVSYWFPPAEPQPALTATVPKRNTKAIGDRSEAAVLAALSKRGYLVSVPFGENQRYDLIADDGERLLRIQVKTGRLRRGVIAYRSCSTHYHRRRGPSSNRGYSGEIDFLAVYCPENEKVYLLPEEELMKTHGHLRILPTANRQDRNVRWAARFELP